ncbi:MAG: hypothetical protein PGN11_07800 [Quadrisphaera sp.]
MEQQVQRRASRRPVWVLVVIGAALVVWGSVLAAGPVRCGDDVMLPGDRCSFYSSSSYDLQSYGERQAAQQRQPFILVPVGAVLLVAGLGAGFVLARRAESPTGRAQWREFEARAAQGRQTVVERLTPPGGTANPALVAQALVEYERGIAKERRRRRYPSVEAGPVRRTRLASRRPVIRLLALAVVLAAVGLWAWNAVEPRCLNKPMAPGQTCTVTVGREQVERTADQQLASQRRPATWLFYGALGAAVASVPAGLWRGRRVDVPVVR